jgi:hypothetical protein
VRPTAPPWNRRRWVMLTIQHRRFQAGAALVQATGRIET